MDQTELFEKIKKMNLDELLVYQSSARTVNMAINVVGVSLILFILLFSSTIMFIVGGFVLYIAAQTGAGVGRTLNFIEERIDYLSDKELITCQINNRCNIHTQITQSVQPKTL